MSNSLQLLHEHQRYKSLLTNVMRVGFVRSLVCSMAIWSLHTKTEKLLYITNFMANVQVSFLNRIVVGQESVLFNRYQVLMYIGHTKGSPIVHAPVSVYHWFNSNTVIIRILCMFQFNIRNPFHREI